MWILVLVCFLIAVTKSCPNLCNPIKCSTIGSPVLHYLPEFVQIHVLSQWWYPTISSSVIPFSSCLQFSPASGSFPMSQFFFISGGQIIGASASASVLPMNWKCWFPLGLTGFIPLQSKGISSIFSSATVWNINASALSLLYGPTLTSAHSHWKNHSFDYMHPCWQSDISAF